MRISFVSCVAAIVLALALCAVRCGAQSTNAAVGGQITDEQGRMVPGVTVVLTNLNTGVTYEAKTNGDGIYGAPTLPPGIYRANVTKDGFKSIVKGDIELHVQDNASINFQLQVGSVSETVTVQAEGLVINTTDATVSTVVDRQFAENLPLNGRSFQTLIQLTPGVVLTTSSGYDAGQFSVNGQRGSANYWTVDGVSANIGVSSNIIAGNGFAGSLGSFSVLGGTNSLVSVDALQEFRIQTSTYAPEFGRTPGGQISIVTRSGANQFHGTAFEYLRNDDLDANDWFADSAGLPKPRERQNDFGGTLSGPILKERTFFFFSYEGLRLRLPQVALSNVPDVNARQNAIPAMQPFLNMFPLPSPNTPDDIAHGIGQFNASYSNPASLDAYSLRVDHKLNNKWSLFGRYNYSPSTLAQRGFGSTSASSVNSARITTQTGTVGATWVISPTITNDLRFNYSRTNSSSRFLADNFGGAIPLASLPFPSPFTNANALLGFRIFSLNDFFPQGDAQKIVQRQINLVDNISVQRGPHSLKFGVDFRRLSPVFGPQLYNQGAIFLDVPSAESGNLLAASVISERGSELLFRNLGVFGQDTWRVLPRLTVTYGLRWDIDFAPSALSGPNLSAVTGFNLTDLSKLALAPSGTPPFATPYGGVAPRIGVAYQLSQNQDWGTVVRGGFGIFYDLATQEVGNLISNGFPFQAENFFLGPIFGGTATFPLSSANAAPPPITPASLMSPFSTLPAFDPHLKLPYTLQWNGAVEQGLGRQQSLSISYIGAVGRRLIQSTNLVAPNPSIGSALLVTNSATDPFNRRDERAVSSYLPEN